MAEGIVIGNLTIPVIKGDKGDTGEAGKIISISLVMLSPSSTAYAVNNGSTTQAQIELGIPKGLSVSTININASGELVFTFNDGTSSNVGKVVGKGISEVTVTDDFDFVVTYTDGTSVTVCNLEDEILGAINDILESYYTKTEIDNKGFITKEVNNLTNYTLKTSTGSSIELSINNSTYVMTLNLKNASGTVISTGTVDLPLETMVVGATYDNTNKKIVLTLKNGSTIDVPVADLVSGLQAEITNANKLSADLVDDTSTTHKFTSTSEKNSWNAKYTKPSGGIPKTDLASDVQTSLGKADTAVQDVSGKEDVSNKIGTINSSSTTAQYPHAKAVYDELVLRDEKISDLKTKNELLVKDHVPIENTGAELQLTGTGDLPMELVPYGNITQETTSISGGDEYDSPSIEHESPVKVVDGEYETLVQNKNYNNGINQLAYLNVAVNNCGISSGNSGLYIKVNGGNYTISTKNSQERYRVACAINEPSEIVQIAYNGVNKDGTSDNITINTTGYNYLVVNATDLSVIQIEKELTPTSYVAHQEQTVSIDTSSNPLYSENDCYKYLNSEQAIALGLNTGAGWYCYNEYANQDFTTGVSSVTINDMKSNGQFYSTVGGTVSETTITFSGTTTGEGNIVYELATPTYTKITDTDLINSLEALKDMQSYYDITNISQTHSDGQADMNIQANALKSLKAMQSETNTLLNAKVDKSSFVYDSNTETLSITMS